MMKTLLISMLCAALVVPAVSAAEEGKKPEYAPTFIPQIMTT